MLTTAWSLDAEYSCRKTISPAGDRYRSLCIHPGFVPREGLRQSPDAAVVGEPTSLEPCIAQRGQLLLELVWEGDQAHAGWAAGRIPPPVNAIASAARDLVALDGLSFERRHPLLGSVAMSPTIIQAGVARNVIPSRCSAVLDVRTTPAYSHGEVAAAIADRITGRVEVLSDRLVPAETPAGSRLLDAVRAVRPEARPFASPTCSDWVFLRHVDGVKLGPGDSSRSHTADEWITLEEVEAAVKLYADLAGEYLR